MITNQEDDMTDIGMIARAQLLAHADAWLRADARGRDGGVRQKLAEGVSNDGWEHIRSPVAAS
jgi:hypothetical protein